MSDVQQIVARWFPVWAVVVLGCSSKPAAPVQVGTAGGSGASTGGAGAGTGAGAGGMTTTPSGGNSSGGATGSAGSASGGQTGVMPPPGGYATITVVESSRNAAAGAKPEHCDSVAAPAIHTAAASTRSTVAIDATKPRQTITGFGAAITEAVASTIAILPAAQQTEIYDAYFSPTTGSAYTLTRTHIGSCDFALSDYSYDDTANDTTLANFSIAHDQMYLIPALKAALASSGGTLKVLSSLWSAPGWMKTGATGLVGVGQTTLPGMYGGSVTPANYGVFANYLSKYVQAYKAAGVNIWALTPTNEPLGVGQTRESMVWSPAAMDTFLRMNLAPQFQTDGLAPKVFVFDHNKDDMTTANDVLTWANALFGANKANPGISGTAVHWYGSTFKVYEATLDALHNVDPSKDILFDEGTADGFIFNTLTGGTSVAAIRAAAWWQNDDWFWTKDNYDWGWLYADKVVHPPYETVNRYARDIIVGLNHWYTGWIDWNGVLNKFGGIYATGGGLGNFGDPGVSHIPNGVPTGIMVDEANPTAATLYYTPIFYVMRHFSKYILPGAKILSSTVTLAAGVTATDYANTATQDGQALLAVAAQNPDGSMAVVLFNETGKPIDYSITVGSQAADSTIPAQAMQTLVWK